MKKNAILVAGIMFATACATSQGQRAEYDPAYNPPVASQHDPAVSGSAAGSVSGSVSGENYDPDSDEEFMINDSERDTDLEAEYSVPDDDISADSSIRGGSLDARGYDQDANLDEIEPAPDPINPAEKADSSIRGGSINAREREWNHDAEPSSGFRDPDRHLKADSSIRGGSLEARGGREAMMDDESRDDFGQGSSATWESDKAQGSVRGSANWNPCDDLLPDDDSEAQSTLKDQYNNDASVGGAAESEVGEGESTFEDLELEMEMEEDEIDLNSSEELEKNISGEYDLETSSEPEESSEFESSIRASEVDPNARDSFSSSTSSERSTDIQHDESDLTSSEVDEQPADSELEAELEAAGAAASAESGEASSEDDNTFESNDPVLNSTQSPLETGANEPDFLYQDNPARGVGSHATGEFGEAEVNQDIGLGTMSDEQLEQHVKSRLTSETTGTQGLTMSEVARNIQVSAENGEITLTGTVPSEKHKDLIEIHAREMAGVKSVNNQLTVSEEADPSERISPGSDLEDFTSELQD